MSCFQGLRCNLRYSYIEYIRTRTRFLEGRWFRIREFSVHGDFVEQNYRE